MTRRNSSELLAKDLKIERITLRNLRVRIRQRVKELGVELEDIQFETMTKSQGTMFEYAKLSLIGVELSIVKLTIVANNFEIKLNIIQMIQ